MLGLKRRSVGQGPVAEVFTEGSLQKTYGGRVTVRDEGSGAVARTGKPTGKPSGKR